MQLRSLIKNYVVVTITSILMCSQMWWGLLTAPIYLTIGFTFSSIITSIEDLLYLKFKNQLDLIYNKIASTLGPIGVDLYQTMIYTLFTMNTLWHLYLYAYVKRLFSFKEKEEYVKLDNIQESTTPPSITEQEQEQNTPIVESSTTEETNITTPSPSITESIIETSVAESPIDLSTKETLETFEIKEEFHSIK